MIINKIKIGQFGKLKNKNISFTDGLNIIYGNNESGKSTITSFIETMLYGMTGARKNIHGNLRTRYMPWGEYKAEGQMDVGYKNKSIAIYRSFGSKKSEDRSKIFNVITGDEIKEIDLTAPGKSILGFGAESFKKTVLVKQLATGIDQNENDEIISMLINMSETGDADTSYNKAQDLLKKYKKQLTNTEKKPGKLDEKKAEYSYTYQLLQRLQMENEAIIKALEQNNIDVIEVFEHMSKQESVFGSESIDAIKEQMSQISLLRKMIKEKTEPRDTNMQKEEIEYGTGQIAEDYIAYKEALLKSEKYANELKQIEENYSQLKRLQQQMKLVTEEYPDIDIFDFEFESAARNYIRNIQEKQNTPQVKPSKIKKVSFAMSGSFFIGFLGIFLGIYYKNYYLFGLSVLPMVVLIKRLTGKNIEQVAINEESHQLMLEKLQGMTKAFENRNVEEIENEIESYKRVREKYLQIEMLLNEKKEQCKIVDLQVIKSQYNQETAVIHDLMIKYNEESKESLEYILSKGVKMSEADSLRIASQRVYKQTEEDINNQARKIYDEVVEQILMAYESAITRARSNTEQIKEEVLDLSKELQAVDFAINRMDTVFSQFHESFGKKINSRASQILDEISGGKYKELFISKAFDVKLMNDEDGHIHHIDYFSNGTWDQVYLALRLSIIECIQDNYNIKMPLVLDDIFVQYDDERTAHALKYLYEYSQNHQVILLTCQNREREILRDYEHIHWICLD